MVNANTRSASSFPGTNLDMSLIYNEKIYRSEYIVLQNSLVENLTRAAVQLKGVDQSTRAATLRGFLAGRNRWLEEHIQAKKIDLNSKYAQQSTVGTDATTVGSSYRWR